MELGIPNAPEAGLTSRANTGYAAVLDQSSFDPITFMENYNAEREKKQVLDAQKQMATPLSGVSSSCPK